MLSLLLAGLFFAGIHLGIAGTSLRDRVIGNLGENGYRAAFAVASIIGLGWLVAAYNRAPYLVTWGWSGFAIVDMSTFLSDLDFSRGLHAGDHFIGRPHGVGEKSVVDHRGLIAVAPDWMPRSGGCVLDYCDLEALFQQLA